MTCNVGGIERGIRLIVGIGLLALGAFSDLPAAGTAVVLLIGTVAVLTGAIGFCPLWKLLGINTCPPPSGGKA
jgi:hypothetical protein